VTLRRRTRARLFVLSAVLLALVWGCVIEPSRLVVHQYSSEARAWAGALNGLRIAVLSDVHTDHTFNGPGKVRRAVDTINERRPDLVLLLGDYTKGTEPEMEGAPPEQTAALLGKLTALLGVFSVLGNHDWWYNGERVRQALEAQGIRVLHNQVAAAAHRGAAVWLVGLADFWTGTPLAEQTVAKVPPASRSSGRVWCRFASACRPRW
jgi:predicted MPP superfamily phosphohydrolase